MTVDAPALAQSGSASFGAALRRRLDGPTLVTGCFVLAAGLYLATFGLSPGSRNWPLAIGVLRVAHTVVPALLMFVAVLAADEATDHGAPRLATYAAAVLGSALLGSLLGSVVWGLALMRDPAASEATATLRWVRRIDVFLMASLVGGLATYAHVSARTVRAARRRQQAAEEARALAQRRTLESRLQALQARVEPAFLFGVLGGVDDLHAVDAEAGRAMLEDLIVYLRAALPHLRESTSTVSQEHTLARAWLDILARSGTPWQASFDMEPAVADARVPALVLLPLVQHAVSIAPAEAPHLAIRARTAGNRLHLEVETSTHAFADGPRGHPVLARIEERLRALHGDAMRFACEVPAPDGGSRAVVVLPLERAPETRRAG